MTVRLLSKTLPDLETILEQYLAFLAYERNQSPNTVRSYLQDLALFFQHVQDKPLVHVTSEDISDYLASMSRLGPATRRRRFFGLKAFFSWSIKQKGYLRKHPMENLDAPKGTKPNPRPIPPAEFEALMDQVLKTKALSLRDQVIILLAADTGRRIQEILSLTVEDLQHMRDYYRLVIRGKGGRYGTVDIDPIDRAYKLFRKYLKETGYQSGPLFRSEKGSTAGQPLSYRAFKDQWDKLTERYTIHQLRHTMGTRLVNDPNGGLYLAQKQLGHASPQSTQVYAQLYDETHRKQMLAVKRGRVNR